MKERIDLPLLATNEELEQGRENDAGQMTWIQHKTLSRPQSFAKRPLLPPPPTHPPPTYLNSETKTLPCTSSRN